MFNPHEVYLANRVLERAGLLETKENFKVIRVREFLGALDLYLAENNNTEVLGVTQMFIQRLEAYESDNPEMLLITDRDSDI
jgi:hypothetical protein